MLSAIGMASVKRRLQARSPGLRLIVTPVTCCLISYDQASLQVQRVVEASSQSRDTWSQPQLQDRQHITIDDKSA